MTLHQMRRCNLSESPLHILIPIQEARNHKDPTRPGIEHPGLDIQCRVLRGLRYLLPSGSLAHSPFYPP